MFYEITDLTHNSNKNIVYYIYMYKNKYFKYKNKYLNFKNNIGGGINQIVSLDWKQIKNTHNLDDHISHLNEFGEIHILYIFDYEYIYFLKRMYGFRPESLHNIPCKILSSFDGVSPSILLNPDNYFSKLNQDDKIKFTYYIYTEQELENIADNNIYKYHKCINYTRDQSFKYLFYNKEILDRFKDIFEKHNIFYDDDYLLNLSCTWDNDRDIEEKLLISILFASYKPANIQVYSSNKNFLINTFDTYSVDADYMIDCLDERFNLLPAAIRDNFKNAFVQFYISSVKLIYQSLG